MEAVMLRLPLIDAEGMEKLARAAELAKGGDAWVNEPRVPAGQSEGGQWTTGGGGAPSSPATAPRRQPTPTASSARAGAGQPRTVADDGAEESVVSSRVVESRHQNPNGFFQNSAGGGTFYIPTTNGQNLVRPTEVHALDANGFQVSWDNGVIRLKDSKGGLFAVDANDENALHAFNATTGRTIGVSIYTFPGKPLGSPPAPPTPAEQREFVQQAAAQAEGTRQSIESPSGHLTTAAGELVAQLPFVALGGAAEAAARPLSEMNRVLTATQRAVRLGTEGEGTVALSAPKVPIRVPGTGRLRIPDGLDEAAKILEEVKNTRRLSLTQQLRDYIAFCKRNGYIFKLYYHRAAKLSKPLLDAISRGDIIGIPYQRVL
jgi:hypothetical protein